MFSISKSTKNGKGEIGKSFKSRKQVSTKFKPPSHPAIVITSAFTAPHIDKLKKKLEENYIAYGMQTSKKKLNRPPGAPDDKNFIIVDDSQGNPVLQGDFLGIKMCRVDYPNKNNLDAVIAKFDSYIGLGKQQVEEEQFCEADGYQNWEEHEENQKLQTLKQKTEIKKEDQRDSGEQANKILAQRVELQQIQELAKYKNVFSSKDKQNSNNKKSKKQKKKDKEKNGMINLKSIKQTQLGQDKQSQKQKRILFILLTSYESSRYLQYINQFYESKNKRIIIIKSIQEYYKYSYDGSEGENCLLVSPNAAFKQLHRFRNINSVYIYGEDEKLCASLVKGNIKKAAFTPTQLDKILLEEGFNKSQICQLVPPIRVAAAGTGLDAEVDIMSKNLQKPSLFDKFMGFIKGKSQPKDKNNNKEDKNNEKLKEKLNVLLNKEESKVRNKQNQKPKQKVEAEQPNAHKAIIPGKQKMKTGSSSSNESASNNSLSKSSEDSKINKKQPVKPKKIVAMQPKQKQKQKQKYNSEQKSVISLGRIIQLKNAEPLLQLASNLANDEINKNQPQKKLVKKSNSYQPAPFIQAAALVKKQQLDLQCYKNSKLPPKYKQQRKLSLGNPYSPSAQKQQEQKQSQDRFLQKSALKNQQKKLLKKLQMNEKANEAKVNFQSGLIQTKTNKSQSGSSQSSSGSLSDDDLAYLSKNEPKDRKLVLNTSKDSALVLEERKQSIQSTPKQIVQLREQDKDEFSLAQKKNQKRKKTKTEDSSYFCKADKKKALKVDVEKIKNSEQHQQNYFGNIKASGKMGKQSNRSKQDQGDTVGNIKDKDKNKNCILKNASEQVAEQKQQFYVGKNREISRKNVFKKNFPDLKPEFYLERYQKDSDANKQFDKNFDTPKISRTPSTQTHPHLNHNNNSETFNASQPKSSTKFLALAPHFEKGLYQGNPPKNLPYPHPMQSPRLQSKGNKYQPQFLRNNRSVTQAEPRDFNLPFDESKYDRFVEGGVVVYKPKKHFAHNLPSRTLSPKVNSTHAKLSNNPIHVNPHLTLLHTNSDPHTQHFPSPNFFNSSNLRSLPTQQRAKSLSVQSASRFNQIPISFPQKREQAQDQIKNSIIKTATKNPGLSTYEYFMNSQPNRFQAKIPESNNNPTSEQDFPYYCSKQKQKYPLRSLYPINTANINLLPVESGLKKPNIQNLRKRPPHKKHFVDSLDSDSTDEPNMLNIRSKSLGRYVDPMSQILENACSKPAEPNKNYSILYLVHSKLNPKIIKEIFEISDESDTIQTYSHPDKLRDIVKKGENVFDYILVFPNSPGILNLPEIDYIKGLHVIQYDPGTHKPALNHQKIILRNTADLPSILARNRMEIRHGSVSKPQKNLAYIYFKDFNHPIREMAKILKARYPNAQIRRYFGLMDLPTRLPSDKHNLTMILLDQVGFNQISAYCSNQQKDNKNIVKICIPKSSEALKLCQKSETAQNIIWLTQKEVQNGDFIIKCIQKRFQ